MYTLEELSAMNIGCELKTFVELQDLLESYLKSEDGQKARERSDSYIIIKEKLPDGSLVESRMRTNDLYIREVTVYDENGNEIFRETDDGDIGVYGRDNNRTILIPIEFYRYAKKYSSLYPPGFLIRSTAFRISESLRFVRYYESRESTPFCYTNQHRSKVTNFCEFQDWYKNWADLTKKGSKKVNIPHIP